MLRRAQPTREYWVNKKLVIWSFPARDFTDSDKWRSVQSPVPMGYSEKRFDYYFAYNTLKLVEATPLHILVEGDIAIIQLMARSVSSVDGEPDEESWVAWTDIMRRDNVGWRWIADHGHVPGGSN